MKHLLVVLMVLMVLIPFSDASGTTIGLTPGFLWTTTSIGVLATDAAELYKRHRLVDLRFPSPPRARGQPARGGPEEWITNQQHGQLIGYIGSALDLNAFPRGIAQNDLGLFAIGAGPLTETGRAGTLWLGFNDGYVTGIFGNSGTGSRMSISTLTRSPQRPAGNPAPAGDQPRRRGGVRSSPAQVR